MTGGLHVSWEDNTEILQAGRKTAVVPVHGAFLTQCQKCIQPSAIPGQGSGLEEVSVPHERGTHKGALPGPPAFDQVSQKALFNEYLLAECP